MNRLPGLLLLFGCFVPVSLGYMNNVLPSRRKVTPLHMGLGSFVKKRLLGHGGDDKNADAQNTNNAVPSLSAPAAQPPPPVPPITKRDDPPQRSSPLQTKGVVASAQRAPYPGAETTQDRINRVKQGKMTEEEKQKFLATTLKNVTPEKPMPYTGGNPPVRQPLLDDSALIKRGQRSSATPFPKDSMLREVVTGRRDYNAMDEWTSSNKKKKEYFDMVTNPNRFNTFNTQAGSAQAQPPQPTSFPAYSANDDIAASVIPWETDLSTSSGTPSPTIPTVAAPTFDPGDANHLGARLEAAAMAEEKRQREVRRAVELQREEERRRQSELQRAREEEMAMREAEAARRKEEALEMARAQEARRREEERLRQEQMMKAQDEYWANKLRAERQRKLEKMGQQEQAVEQARVAEDDRQQEQASWEQASAAAQRQEEAFSLPALAPLPPPPAPRPAPMWNSPSVATSTRGPLPLYRSTNPFLDEQAARRAEIERAKEEQLAKLKALNSPLPSGPPQGLTPAMAPVRRAPLPSPYATPSPGMTRTTQFRAPAPSPVRGLNELQRIVNHNALPSNVEAGPRDTSYADAMNTPPPAPVPTYPKPASGNGFMGRIFGGNEADPGSGRSQPEPEPQRKVVRQALPQVDEDEEFEAFGRNGPNKNMSIKDALQTSDKGSLSKGDQENKSKMWGVDMSRFND